MKIAIIGRTEILYDCVLALRASGFEVVCILTAKEAPEYEISADDFKAFANDYGIPFQQGPNINDHFDFLRESKADIGVSMNYPTVVPQNVIDIFPLGILNAHGGDLPRYRGNACQAWAILRGENRIGLCVHRMIGGELDSGDIIARSYLGIDNRTKITAVWNWMREMVPILILDAVSKLSNDSHYVLERQSRDPKDALRCYPRTPADCVIDWSRPAIEVLRLINASNKPYAGANCIYKKKRVIVWDAELLFDGENFCAVPGQVTGIGSHSIDIACGVGKVRINLIEIDGHTAPPRSFICSIRDRLE